VATGARSADCFPAAGQIRETQLIVSGPHLPVIDADNLCHLPSRMFFASVRKITFSTFIARSIAAFVWEIMLRMISYPYRPQSGHTTCYSDRTHHVLTTVDKVLVDNRPYWYQNA
jgi:hypothetical protein